jgi:hypothetical protein
MLASCLCGAFSPHETKWNEKLTMSTNGLGQRQLSGNLDCASLDFKGQEGLPGKVMR